MPKPIINTNNKQQFLSEDLSLKEHAVFKSPELVFRKKRSQEYINIIKNIDIDYAKVSQDKINECVKKLQESAPEAIFDESFIGVLGKCELGAEYDVHTISKNFVFGIDEVTHQFGFGRMILQHFKIGESLPSELEKGRSLAANPSYLFVEVYNDKLIAVQTDGTVAIIKD